jgi:3-methyladenine DNA glycosylase AlkD
MTNKEYQKILNFLKKEADLEYRNFHKKLLKNDKINVLGVRTPILKKIAKEISKGDYKSFIKLNSHNTYEETVIHGLILGYIKVSEEELFKLIDEFLCFNNNWAVNDITCANLKAFKKISFDKVLKYINSDNPWIIRFGLVLILDYYINEENIDKIFILCDNISGDYYVKMANAWLISICYIKFPNKTFKFLKSCKLDKFTFNKTISKICDSYRVTEEKKNKLKGAYRK